MATNDPRVERAKPLRDYLHNLATRGFYVPVSEIEPGLFIGGRPTPQFPKVDAVLSLSDKMGPEPEVSGVVDNEHPYAIFNMPIFDKGPFPSMQWLDIAVGVVEKCVENGWSILVHCDAGMSRSATVVVAYIMKRDGLSADDALNYVLRKRAIAPNQYFLVGLMDWEQYLQQDKNGATTSVSSGGMASGGRGS